MSVQPRYLAYNAIFALVVVTAWNIFFTSHVVVGDISEDFMDGDHALVSKLSYGLRRPFSDDYLASWAGVRRGDVVYYHLGSGEPLAGKVLDHDHETARIARRVDQAEPISSGRQRQDVVDKRFVRGTLWFTWLKGEHRERGPGWKPL